MYHKYIKYINYKKYQSGGHFDDPNSSYLIIENDQIITKNIIGGKPMEQNDPYFEKGFISEKIQNQNIIKYNYYTNSIEPQNIIKIQYRINDELIMTANYKNKIPINKSLLLFHKNIRINILLDNFTSDDNTYTTGSGNFIISNPDFQIKGTGKLFITNNQKNITIYPRKIIIQTTEIDLNNKQEITNLKNIDDIFEKQNKFTEKNFIGQCNSIFRKDIPSDYEDKKPIYRYIISIICGKFYYFSLLDSKFKNILLLYPGLLKIILKDDLENIYPKLNKLYTDKNIVDYQINLFPKTIPSIIMNKYILMKNSKNQFVELPKDYEILFDSGNASITVLSRDIIKELSLTTDQACKIKISSLSGETKLCGEFVNLQFKFSPNYKDSNNKIYNIIAFVSDNLKNKIIFSHLGALEYLFDDNYKIQFQYDNEDIRKTDIENINKQVNYEYDKLDNILTNIISGSYDPYMVETFLKSINSNQINSIRAATNIEKTTRIFKKLREAYEKTKNTQPEIAKLLENILENKK